ncbi:hypothetical protein [Dietzia kunjamensis]|uniref:hypothetical protein n=1 Tax=Dietzia kunjamensis TaxID=322509 RepID=UPI00388F65AB
MRAGDRWGGSHRLSCVAGWGRNPFDNFTDGPLPDTIGAYVDNAAAIKKTVSIPVIAVGRVFPG